MSSGTTSLPATVGRRGTHVGGEVAERRVLLVADRRDDGHGARGDRADDALVAEREQILEAAAAAREHDHVDVRLAAESSDRGDDLRAARGPWTYVSATSTVAGGKRR